MLQTDLQQLASLVVDIAGRELPPRFNCRQGERKSDGSLVTEADLVVQQALADALHRHWPDIGLLGEEMSAPAQQAALQNYTGGVWCIDPLDGTSNFAVGVPYYAVSVALVRDGRPLMGVVYDPSRNECFTALAGQGAWLNDQPLGVASPAATLRESLALIDFKRLSPTLAARLAAEPPYKSQRSFGAVALDWCWLAAGRGHLYLHGRQKLWDYAAGYLVLLETGGMALTLSGEDVFNAELEPRSAAAALDPALFEQWKNWLQIPDG
jgi:myo-inositol-1(or 4)-monophosphatase